MDDGFCEELKQSVPHMDYEMMVEIASKATYDRLEIVFQSRPPCRDLPVEGPGINPGI